VVGAVVLIYSLIGGSWAVTATDFLQTLILIPITILVGVLCLVKLGGVGALFQGIQNMGLSSAYGVFNAPDQFPLRAHTYAWAVALLVKNVIGYTTFTSAQRSLLRKGGRQASQAAWLGLVMTNPLRECKSYRRCECMGCRDLREYTQRRQSFLSPGLSCPWALQRSSLGIQRGA